MMFIYLDIIRHQILDDTIAPLHRVIDTNRRVKNGYACSIEPNHRKVFSNLELKFDAPLGENIELLFIRERASTVYLRSDKK